MITYMLAILTFAQPIVLLAIFFSLIPIIFHLLSRINAQKVLFPPFRFLKETDQKTARKRKIENLLLLLLRISVFSLIPLALALPFYKTTSSNFSSKSLFLSIIIDNTCSMARKLNPSITAFDQASNLALRLVSRQFPDIPPPNKFLLATISGKLAHSPLISSNKNIVIDQIKQIKLSGAENKISTIINRATTIMKNDKTTVDKILILLTDLHKTTIDWKEIKANPEIPIILLPIAKFTNNTNLGISTAEFLPPIVKNRPTLINLNIYGNTSKDSYAELKFIIDSKPAQTKSFIIHSGKVSKEVTLPLTIPENDEIYGKFTLKTKLNETLLIDNEYFFAFAPMEKLKLAIITDPQRLHTPNSDAFFVSSAIEACTWLTPIYITPSELNTKQLQTFDTIVLITPKTYSEKFLSTLTELLSHSKTTLVIFPNLDSPQSLFKLINVLKLGSNPKIATSQTPLKVAYVNSSIPPISTLNLSEVSFRYIAVEKYLHITPSFDSIDLIRLENNITFLLKKIVNNSKIYLFTISANPKDSTFPLNPLFPILLAGFAELNAHSKAHRTYPADAPFTLDLTDTGSLIAPTGKFIAKFQPGRKKFRLSIPGIYTLKYEHKPPIHIAINHHPVKNLTTLSPSALSREKLPHNLYFAQNTDHLHQILTRLHKGSPIWDYFLTLALLVLLAETLLANFRKSKSTSMESL